MDREQSRIDYHILLDVLPNQEKPILSFRQIYETYCTKLDTQGLGTKIPSEDLFKTVMQGVAALDSAFAVGCNEYDHKTNKAVGDTFSYLANIGLRAA